MNQPDSSPRQIRWVVFDLFGTLVPQFPRVAHDQALGECAEIAGLDAHRCREAWRNLYDRRVRGEIRGIGGHLRAVADEQGVELDHQRCQAAIDSYLPFARRLLDASPDTITVLQSLRDDGHGVGILSNAHDDIADVFHDSTLSPLIDRAVFSCRIGHRKRDGRAFDRLLHALGSPSPGSVMFVGDGSDEELSAASAADLNTVLLRSDRTDAYDTERPDVDRWTGPVISELSSLRHLLVQ